MIEMLKNSFLNLSCSHIKSKSVTKPFKTSRKLVNRDIQRLLYCFTALGHHSNVVSQMIPKQIFCRNIACSSHLILFSLVLALVPQFSFAVCQNNFYNF